MRRIVLPLLPLLLPLLLLGGCLEYEIRIETVVAEDGSFRRTVAIRERSDKPKTWTRYAPPKSPYELAGDEANGFVATLDAKAGEHPGGLRVVVDDISGNAKDGEDAKTLESAEILEGEVEVAVQDILIGKLFRYTESIDVGIDTIRFRKDFDFALALGLDLLMKAMQHHAPDVDFAPVRKHAAESILPDLRGSLLIIHSELISAFRGIDREPSEQPRTTPELHAVQSILLELARVGAVPEDMDFEKLKETKLDDWELDDRLWNRLLAPLENATPAWKTALKKKLFHPEDGEGLPDDFWERAVPEAKRKETEERLKAFVRAGLGAPFVNNILDTHEVRVRVRLPGTLLRADLAELHDWPTVQWQAGAFVNPSFSACSFVPGDRMVGEVASAQDLIEFARRLTEATDAQREDVLEFLDAAKKHGVEAARGQSSRSDTPLSSLHHALRQKREADR